MKFYVHLQDAKDTAANVADTFIYNESNDNVTVQGLLDNITKKLPAVSYLQCC